MLEFYSLLFTVFSCVYFINTIMKHGITPAYLGNLCIPITAISGRQHLRSAVTGTLLVPRSRTATGQLFCSQRPSHMEPSATSTTVTGPVGERLQVGTKDAPDLDCPAPLRRFHDFDAG